MTDDVTHWRTDARRCLVISLVRVVFGRFKCHLVLMSAGCSVFSLSSLAQCDVMVP